MARPKVLAAELARLPKATVKRLTVEQLRNMLAGDLQLARTIRRETSYSVFNEAGGAFDQLVYSIVNEAKGSGIIASEADTLLALLRPTSNLEATIQAAIAVLDFLLRSPLIDHKEVRRLPKATVNARMKSELAANLDVVKGFKARQWANHLGCSVSSIGDAQTWKDLELLRKKSKAERAKDRRGNLSG